MSTHFNRNEAVLHALQKYKVAYTNIVVSEGQNDVIITLEKEADPSNLRQFTSHLSALNLHFKSSFQSQTGLINIIVY